MRQMSKIEVDAYKWAKSQMTNTYNGKNARVLASYIEKICDPEKALVKDLERKDIEDRMGNECRVGFSKMNTDYQEWEPAVPIKVRVESTPFSRAVGDFFNMDDGM